MATIDNSHINEFGTAWRKAAKKVLKLPPDAHNDLIPLVLNSLPFIEDTSKRPACFYRVYAERGIAMASCLSVYVSPSIY